MLSNVRLRPRRLAALALALPLVMSAPQVAMPTTAMAEQAASQSAVVRGADALTWGDAFDCATVSGLGGSTLYADVVVGGKTVTTDMTYNYDNASDTFGVVQLNAKASYVASHSGNITLNFYGAKAAERAEGASALLSAKVYAVCIQVDGQPLGGSAADSMIGIRTARAGEETLAFSAPSQVVREGATYALVGGGKVTPRLKDGVLYVSYQKLDASQTVTGKVTYVDENGNELASDEYSFDASKGKTVSLRSSVEHDGTVYTHASKVSQVTLTATNPEQRVWCVARAKADTDTQEVTITYKSSGDATLMVDRVNVGAGGYYYAPAKSFSQANDAAVSLYNLTGATDSLGNAYTADEAAELKLARDGAKEYTLTYAAEATELTYTVNFALVSAGERGNTQVSIYKSETGKVTSTSAASVATPETLEVDGKTYTRSGSSESLTYSWGELSCGRMLTDTVYYVAEDVVAPKAYEVTVRYVDAVSGAEIGSEKLACEPDGGALSITSPESVTYEGSEYERLGGQSAPITHHFYAPYRTYTVYYAKPGSMSEGDTIVNRTVVIDGGVRYYTIDADGNVDTGDGSSSATSGASSNGGLVATAPYTSLSTEGTDGSSASTDVTAPNGNSAYEERISDDETPLASGTKRAGMSAGIIAACAAALAAIAACFFVIVRKKRNANGLDDSKEA